MRHMKKAALMFEDKTIYPDGAILEMRIWRLPEANVERLHGLKYSLYYGKNGVRLVAYDNERGKGDHRHYTSHATNVEEAYVFTTAAQLVADFMMDVARIRSEE